MIRRICRIIALTFLLAGLLVLLSIPYKYIEISHNKEVGKYVEEIIKARKEVFSKIGHTNDDNGFKDIKIFKLPLTSTDILGVCLPLLDTIIINSRTWDEYDDAEKTLIIGHELGHCKFNYGHVDLKFFDGCPAIIMGSNLPSKMCIKYYMSLYAIQIIGFGL